MSITFLVHFHFCVAVCLLSFTCSSTELFKIQKKKKRFSLSHLSLKWSLFGARATHTSHNSGTPLKETSGSRGLCAALSELCRELDSRAARETKLLLLLLSVKLLSRAENSSSFPDDCFTVSVTLTRCYTSALSPQTSPSSPREAGTHTHILSACSPLWDR